MSWRRREEPNRYADRRAAGAELATLLAEGNPSTSRTDWVVLGLPRGGVIVAAAVAAGLRARLDVVCVRKLGVPWQPELAMGAVAAGARVLNHDLIARLGISAEEVASVERVESQELARREQAYRSGRPPVPLRDTVAVVVDDGLATGATASAALRAVRAHAPRRVMLAVPVAPAEALATVAADADDVCCPLTPRPFDAVGRWYADFRTTSDDEVRAALAEATA